MKVIGLTGSIGTGKSTVTRQFAWCGAAFLDSDTVVHRLLASGGEAVTPVAELFPHAFRAGVIDRKKLGAEVFGNPAKLAMLEAVIHPLVRQKQNAFLRHARRMGKLFAVLDIPLLFETGGEKRCDVTVVTTAPRFLQRSRVLKRPSMTPEKFAHILAAQMPDGEKRRRADFIVHTGRGMALSMTEVRHVLCVLQRSAP